LQKVRSGGLGFSGSSLAREEKESKRDSFRDGRGKKKGDRSRVLFNKTRQAGYL